MDSRMIADHLFVKKIDMEEAKAQVKEYDYVIAHMISELQFGTLDCVSVNWEELVEMHAFGLNGELHIFGSPGELEAVKV